MTEKQLVSSGLLTVAAMWMVDCGRDVDGNGCDLSFKYRPWRLFHGAMGVDRSEAAAEMNMDS